MRPLRSKNTGLVIALAVGAISFVGLVVGLAFLAHHVSSSSPGPSPSSSPSSSNPSSPNNNTPSPSKRPGTGGETNGGGGTCSDAAAVVAHHNAMRAKHDAGPLRWSDAVAASAQAHADRCEWRHSGGPYGENIAGGVGRTCLNASQAWYDKEIGGMNWHIPEGGPGSGSYFDTSGHLTAMVWKATTEIGCGVRTCPDGGNLIVCQYNPAGNIFGGFAANVGRPIS